MKDLLGIMLMVLIAFSGWISLAISCGKLKPRHERHEETPVTVKVLDLCTYELQEFTWVKEVLVVKEGRRQCWAKAPIGGDGQGMIYPIECSVLAFCKAKLN